MMSMWMSLSTTTLRSAYLQRATKQQWERGSTSGGTTVCARARVRNCVRAWQRAMLPPTVASCCLAPEPGQQPLAVCDPAAAGSRRSRSHAALLSAPQRSPRALVHNVAKDDARLRRRHLQRRIPHIRQCMAHSQRQHTLCTCSGAPHTSVILLPPWRSAAQPAAL